MAVDLQLFLDTHPNDREALETYNSVIERANEFRRRYEAMCGPLYSYRSFNPECWKWYRDPWPWQYGFNMELPEECC